MNLPRRNQLVPRLGTPDQTEGSVNNPRDFHEDGLIYNEKWLYLHLIDDPSGMPQRAIYWHRYDMVATRVRASGKHEWRDDTTLAEELAGSDPRLERELAAHPAIVPRTEYKSVSDFPGKIDLGSYTQPESEVRPGPVDPETAALPYEPAKPEDKPV